MEPLSTTHSAAPTVMVVDDDKDLLWLLHRVLVKEGLQVESFSSAPTMDMVNRIHPAVLFLDVEIGQESGEEVCGRIKRSKAVTRTPVILISSHSKDKLSAVAERCGADGYLTKPFDLHEMTRLAKLYVAARPAA
ncbi:MAG: response regulator [Flavobacteriales bacterium]|nr:response regulator [Flavobacteriales bacterium]